MLGFAPIAGSTVSGVGSLLSSISLSNLTINTVTNTPVLTPDVVSISINNITLNPNLASQTLTQSHNLANVDIIANTSLTTLTLLNQLQNLSSDNLTINTIAGNPVITQDHNLNQSNITINVIFGETGFPFNIIEIPPTEFTQFFPQVPDYGDSASPSDFWTEQTDNITDSNWIEQQNVNLSNTWTEQ